ncbi:hypothetical protein [Actinokineospora xionganensis]|uniref:Peptidase M11 gametolysin domain-containing protein n=1 Tax=Actinokineospora xionganensis TaxID=2684470 RepID=A0ABR7L0G8_9PSEU|nr:hypothetical protein [Actinokineospora xionganensis]MBC6446176.1 hypothetical protein [Actinokineospora xionganensis]
MTSPASKPLAFALALVAAVLGSVGPAAAEPTARRVAVVLVEFDDSALTDVPGLKRKARDLIFDAPGSAARYYAAQSHGQRTMTLAGGEVHGPVTLDGAATCDTKAMVAKAESVLADVPHDDLAVVFPNAKADCGWGGLGEMPGKRTWFPAEHLNQAAVLHEFGHNLGFNHQVRDICESGTVTGCRKDGHSGRTPMGGGGAEVGLSAPELVSMKWLAAGRRVAPRATTSVRLVALHAPESAGGTRAVDVPLGGDRLVVEYRAPGGVDRSVPRGVNVYRVPGGKYQAAHLIDGGSEKSVPVGRTLVAADISVTVLAADATSAEVRIAVGPDLPATTAKPSSPPASATTTAPPSSSTTSATSSSATTSDDPLADDIVVGAPVPAAASVQTADEEWFGYAVIGGALIVVLFGVLLVRAQRDR